MYCHMLDWIEFGLRWVLGLQFIFWGLNGFFHWKAIPPGPKAIEQFSEACIQSGFIMPLVKVLEIIGGALLLTKYSAGSGLFLLAPIVVIISGLHWVHNRANSAPVLVPITLPFVILIVLSFEEWSSLFLK